METPHTSFAMLSVLLLCVSGPATAEGSFEGTSTLDYFGYPNCITLENESTRVVLGTHGGRVLEYSWKGDNAIYLNPEHEGWVYRPGEPTIDPSGGRFDIGPELVIPSHPDLWLGEWAGEITGPRRARLTSKVDKPTGTQLVREFELDETTSRLRSRQIIINVSEETTEWCHWSRTFALGGGICVIPLSEHLNRFPNNYLMYGPGPVVNFKPEDPNIRVEDGHLLITDTPIEPMIAVDTYAGWMAYLMQNDLMFVKRFATYPDRMYNDLASFTFVVWYFEKQMCELEPIGPKERLEPGEAAAYTEDWWLLPYDFPVDRDAIDVPGVADLVAQRAH
jgi:hypothetical protein